jgi:hypothetical protein
MGNLISQSELARLAGVSRNTVSRRTSADGPMSDAKVGSKIDLDHPTVVEWLDGHKVPTDASVMPVKRGPQPKPISRNPKPPKQPKKTTELSIDAIGEIPIDELEHMTLREIITRFGSINGFKRYLDSLKQIAEIRLKDIDIDKRRGILIPREQVAGSVFPMLEVAFGRLVGDVPTALTPQVIARIESGGDDTALDVQKLIHDANARVLRNVKTSLSRMDWLTGE